MKHNYARDKLSLLVRDIDQYTADEFRRQMARIISGATGQDVPDDCHTIKAERDDLAATFSEIQQASQDYSDGKIQRYEFVKKLAFLAAVPPQQNLAEIRAQVLEDLANELWDCGIYTVVTWQFIKQRAEAIRQGGAK